MRLFRPCFIAGWLYNDAIFRIRTGEKLLYLTFDDGPDPESTPEMLDILDKHFVKVLFFCNGKAAEKYPRDPGSKKGYCQNPDCFKNQKQIIWSRKKS